MGAAATAGFIISIEALIKDSQKVTSSYGLATGTEDKCASIIKYLDELKREFDKATAIFQRLLQIKAKIVVLI